MMVSVIIPVYNDIKHIERSVHSVFKQEGVGEILIIDDKSTDGTYEWCLEAAKQYPKIKVYVHPAHVNKGVSASRNLGILKAEMPFISFLDSDDYLLPNRFRAALSFLGANLDADGVYEQVGILQADNSIKPFADIDEVEPEALFDNLQPVGTRVWFHCNGLTIRKKAFIKAGLFDTNLKTSEDALQWFKLAVFCRLHSIHDSQWVAVHQKRDESLTSNKAAVNANYYKMFFILLKWSYDNKLGEKRCNLVLERFFIELYEDKSVENYRRKVFYMTKVFLLDPSYFTSNKIFRRFTGKMIGYL
jgi:glycosyltransferase involved in cell wall biosynthesis